MKPTRVSEEILQRNSLNIRDSAKLFGAGGGGWCVEKNAYVFRSYSVFSRHIQRKVVPVHATQYQGLRYSSIHSLPGHWLEIGSQLHTLAHFTPEEKSARTLVSVFIILSSPMRSLETVKQKIRYDISRSRTNANEDYIL